MASARTRHLRNLLLAFGLLLLGLWMAGSAIWQLGRTAVFVHESVVVTGTVYDVRQKPFESWSETLGQGNWSWPGDVSYQPFVRFMLPGGIYASRLDLEADNIDYTIGQDISIISPPTQPGKARINRWKFLWGADCLQLGIGSLLALIGHALLKRLRNRRPTKAAPAAKAEKNAKSAPRRSSPAAEEAAAPAPKPKPPRKRKNSSAASNGSSSSRRRKKAEAADTSANATPAKPRRSRKKKSDPQQGELPL